MRIVSFLGGPQAAMAQLPAARNYGVTEKFKIQDLDIYAFCITYRCPNRIVRQSSLLTQVFRYLRAVIGIAFIKGQRCPVLMETPPILRRNFSHSKRFYQRDGPRAAPPLHFNSTPRIWARPNFSLSDPD
jgi:hypothetical protein